MRRLFLIAFVFILAGCQTEAKFKQSMNSWIGSDAQALVNQWGYPASTMTAPNGNEVYVYANNGSVYIPQTTTYNTTANAYGNSMYATTTGYSSGGYNINMSCTIYVEVNQAKKVEHISWRGNHCVS